HTAEITGPWQRYSDQPIEELEHAIPAQGDTRSNRHALPKLEVADVLLRNGGHGLLACDHAHFGNSGLHDLLIAYCITQPLVEADLLKAGDLHGALVPELLHELGSHLVLVFGAKPWFVAHDLITSPVRLLMRTSLPSLSSLRPTRVGSPLFGSISMRLLIW